MRIYDLQDSIDKLVANKDFQVEFIGEDGAWTVHISRRKWDNALQRYVYDNLGSSTASDFLVVYDFAAGMISLNSPSPKLDSEDTFYEPKRTPEQALKRLVEDLEGSHNYAVGKWAVVRKETMNEYSQAHPLLVVIKDTEKEAKDYCEEHQGLLPPGMYLSVVPYDDFMRGV